MSRPLAVAVAERLRESLDSPLFQPIGSQAISALARLVEAMGTRDDCAMREAGHQCDECDKADSALRDVAAALGVTE